MDIIADDLASPVLQDDYVSYRARFFDRFQPVTALDMVNQVPGFRLDNSTDSVRGFAGAGGNILINDRRPSAKLDSLADILSRIPSVMIERIELIRGQVRNIDLRGQAAVLNIIMKDDIPAAVQWRAAVRQTFGHGPLKPEANIALTDSWEGVEYNVGIDARPSSVGRAGFDDVLDPDGQLAENYIEGRESRSRVTKANLNLASWAGSTFLQFNSNFTYEDRHAYTDSIQVPLGPTQEQNQTSITSLSDIPIFEAGLDAERELGPDLTGKGIILFSHRDDQNDSLLIETDGEGIQTLMRTAVTESVGREAIVRFEFDWSGLDGHLVQANLERAQNTLDGRLFQTDDTGAGPIEIVVPGANSRVTETRWDFLLKDTWLIESLEVDIGLGAEASTITQTGDSDQSRDFFFLKPQAILNYSWGNGDQTRLELIRQVAQLDLNDFVSSTVFEDDDLALGNPDLRPDTTWVLELGHEKRVGRVGIIKISAFYHWITDVLDLLPLSSNFEAPGNIGDGKRWGARLESTLPLDWLGLLSAKLDVKLRWQDSQVIDPVTGSYRVLSIGSLSSGPVVFDIENRYAVSIDFRQDFQVQKVAWGWSINERAKQYRFKVNELETYDEELELNAFIETSRWFGIRMQILADNLFNFWEERRRIKYSGERELTPVDSTEIRRRTRGERLMFVVSGSF